MIIGGYVREHPSLGPRGRNCHNGYGLGAPHAITVELDFTAVDFPPASPNASVSGRFTYEAASLTSPATSLTSVDLTISGHTYTLPEVGVALFGDTEVIGSTIEGVGNLQSGVNTFGLSYIPSTGMPDFHPFNTAQSQTRHIRRPEVFTVQHPVRELGDGA